MQWGEAAKSVGILSHTYAGMKPPSQHGELAPAVAVALKSPRKRLKFTFSSEQEERTGLPNSLSLRKTLQVPLAGDR